MLTLIEVLGGKDLQGMIRGKSRPDGIRARGRFVPAGALEKVHIGGSALLQPLRTADVQQQTGGIADDDQALQVLSHRLEPVAEHARERAEWVIEPALLDLRRVGLDRSEPADRVETGV